MINLQSSGLNSVSGNEDLTYKAPMDVISSAGTIHVFDYQLLYEMEKRIYDLEDLLSRTMGELEELKKTTSNLGRDANSDALTDIYNRRAFDRKIIEVYDVYKRYGIPFSLLFIDIDHFKTINDTYGHRTGDTVLVLVAKTLKNVLRRTDFLVRYGGDEFSIILYNTRLQQSSDVGEKIRRLIAYENLSKRENEDFHITLSIGIASIRKSDSVESFIHRADECLYLAKKKGRNLVIDEKKLPKKIT